MLESLSPLEEDIDHVCWLGTVAEVVPLLAKLRGENTKLQDYRPDRDESHLVLSMLEYSIDGQNGEIIRYLADAFNPIRYGLQDKWAFSRAIACGAPCLDVDSFRVLWQYNNELATRHTGHFGHPLVIAIFRQDLPMAKFMLEHGADPLYSVCNSRPISQHNYKMVVSMSTPEMKDLLKKFAESENHRTRDPYFWGTDEEFWYDEWTRNFCDRGYKSSRLDDDVGKQQTVFFILDWQGVIRRAKEAFTRVWNGR